jgi:hypothetical protein
MAPLNPLEDSGKKKIIFQGIAKEDSLIADKSAAQVIESNKESAFRTPTLPTLESSGGVQASVFNFSAANVGNTIQSVSAIESDYVPRALEVVHGYDPFKVRPTPSGPPAKK